MDTGRNKQPSNLIANSAGRIVIDGRGRNVWQWNDDQLDSTSIMLKRLENAELALEPTRQLRKLKKASAAEAKSARSEAKNARLGASRRQPEPAKREPELSLDDVDIEQTFSVKPGGGFDPYNRS